MYMGRITKNNASHGKNIALEQSTAEDGAYDAHLIERHGL